MNRLRIVLLERSHDHTESLLLQIRMIGHDAHVCYSPDECVETVKRVKPDAVLLNAGLPMERVYDLGRRLLDLPFSRPAVLRISQPGDRIDCDRSLKSGVRFHLTKPVSPPAIHDALTSCAEV